MHQSYQRTATLSSRERMMDIIHAALNLLQDPSRLIATWRK
jgi:hypothetical protein